MLKLASPGRVSIDSRRPSIDARPLSEIVSVQEPLQSNGGHQDSSNTTTNGYGDELPTPIPIMITPATPAIVSPQSNTPDMLATQNSNGHDHSSSKRASLDEKDRDISRGKKVKQVLKTRVHQGQARISTISKKIGHGVGRRGSLSLKRINSAPGTLSSSRPLFSPSNVPQIFIQSLDKHLIKPHRFTCDSFKVYMHPRRTSGRWRFHPLRLHPHLSLQTDPNRIPEAQKTDDC